MIMENKTTELTFPSKIAGAAEPPPSDPKGQLTNARSSGAPALPSGHHVVFDIEIAKPLPILPNGDKDWDAARRGECGVGCVVIWDSFTKRYHLYDMNNMDACIAHLTSTEYVVSYNGDKFDLPVLRAVTKAKLDVKSYDILHLIWEALGEEGIHKGNSLKDVAWRTLGQMKSGEGANAPILIQQGRWAECLDYCLNDVHLTKELWNHVMETGCIVDINGDDLKIMEVCGC